MNRLAAIIVTFALFPAIASAAQEGGSRVYVWSGNVYVTQGKNPPHRVTISEPIASDTVISTGDKSTALLRFEDGQVVTMQSNSTFQVREYRYDARQIQNSNIDFAMLKGGMRFITGLIGQQRKQAFKLSTPNATVRIRGTEFMLTMVGQSMYGQVVSGKIGMTDAAGTTVLEAGQAAVVASSSASASVVPASVIPSGTFSELLSIPVDPLVVTSSVYKPAAVSGTAAIAAASRAGVSKMPAGGPLAGMAGADSVLTRDQKTASSGASGKSGMGLTGKVGTLGYGAELSFGISDNVFSRIGLNACTYKHNAHSSLANYDLKLQLQTAGAVVDWYPFASFRTSVGLFYDNNKVSLDANRAGGSYIINGRTYSTNQVGSLQGTMSFNRVAPYIGVGWGNPVAKDKGWGLVTDLGVLFQRKPRIDLTAVCTDPLICNQLQSDAAAENAKMQRDLRFFKWWPVVSIGVFYQW